MPIYEYKCEKGHAFEVMQRMADDPISKCTACGRPVQRVFHPIAVHFKGSGFYNTDYGKKGAKADKEKNSDSGSSDSSDSKSSDSKSSDSKSSDSKSGSDSKSADSKQSSDTKKDKGASKASSSAKS